MKKLYFLMSMALASLTGNAYQVTDTITVDLFPLENVSRYASFEGVELPSGNVYDAHLAKTKDDAMQFRSNDNLSSLVQTKSVGKLVGVTIEWNSATAGARVFNLYGSDTPYTIDRGVYTLFEGDSIVYEPNFIEGFAIADATDNVTTAKVEGNDYDYIGFRSNYGALYIDRILLTYEVEEAVQEYTITTEVNEGGRITITDLGNYNQVHNGDKVAAGNRIMIAAVAEDGYVIEKFNVNDYEATLNGATQKQLAVVVDQDLHIVVEFVPAEEPDYCNRYEGINSENGDRNLRSLTLSGINDKGEEEILEVANIQSLYGAIYNDRTDEVFNINPGELVTIKADGNGSWMHGYVWVDWNNDKEFVAVFGEGGAVADNSELVAFNYYNGKDSDGKSASEQSNGYSTSLQFKVPADLTEGTYRLRYIIAWDNIDPCGEERVFDENGNVIGGPGTGHNPFDVAGGSITDITLRYSDLSGVSAVEAAEEAAPVYYNLQGVRVNNPANGVYIMVRGDKAQKVYLSK